MNNNDGNRLKNTISLKEFEHSMGGEPLEFHQYNPEKRAFATLPGGKRIFMAKNIDLEKDLFVSEGIHDAYWLHNQVEVRDSFTL